MTQILSLSWLLVQPYCDKWGYHSGDGDFYSARADGEDVSHIVEDRTRIVDILNLKARRVFAKKEMGISDLGGNFEDLLAVEKQPESREELEFYIERASGQSESNHDDERPKKITQSKIE